MPFIFQKTIRNHGSPGCVLKLGILKLSVEDVDSGKFSWGLDSVFEVHGASRVKKGQWSAGWMNRQGRCRRLCHTSAQELSV